MLEVNSPACGLAVHSPLSTGTDCQQVPPEPSSFNVCCGNPTVQVREKEDTGGPVVGNFHGCGHEHLPLEKEKDCAENIAVWVFKWTRKQEGISQVSVT